MISFLTTNFEYVLLLFTIHYTHTYEYNFSKLKIVTEKLKRLAKANLFIIHFGLILALHLNDHLIFEISFTFFIWNVIINTTDTFICTFYLQFFHFQIRSCHIFVMASISSNVKFVFIFLSTASSKEPILLID